ncbi:hypothetical protein HHK36_001135 [Tetracentron sinense]|uniref:PAR1 protein n=1 Tax=Tetracentron sinense TaxID=13715 RepID=A0A834ZWR8_TETSI|nr:hypothetical protein HHK36_001135 [Tetracentron sinense]
MAFYFSSKTMAILALALALCVQGILVSSLGTRCVLEKHVRMSGEDVYVCRSSEIEADKLKDWIETDQCIEACGLDRQTLGISSDSLMESRFTHKLCSPQCYESCPNIVDLYFNLAAGEAMQEN